MKKITLYLGLVLILFSGCSEEKDPIFKYAEEKNLFKCGYDEMSLIKEAVYTFEDFIATHYSYKEEKNLEKGYINYLNKVESNILPMVERFDDHMLYIIDELKKQPNLWVQNGNETTLNFKSELFKCIADNIQDQSTKTVLQTLIKSNTFRKHIFAPTIKANYSTYYNDRAMATYIALDMFYASLFELDFSLSPEELSKKVIEINKERAGHVH